MTENELFQKYNIVHIDGCRYYLVDLKEKLYNLESTVPYCININGVLIYDGSWKNLIPKVVEEIDSKNPKTIDQLLSITCDWSKQCVFGKTKMSNFTEYRGIYINTNHTAIHAMWIIQLLLREYEIDLDSCEFILKRQPAAEPREVRDFCKANTIEGFKKYLKTIGKKDKTIDIIVKNIDTINSKALSKLSNGYNDFFLIESPTTFFNYMKKAVEYLPKLGYPSSTNDALARQINYLYDYIKKSNADNKLKYKNHDMFESDKNELDKFLDDFDSMI